VSERKPLSPSRRAGLLVTGSVTLAGLPAGLVWLALAPRAKIQIAADGSGYYVDPSPHEYIHADLLYAAICAVVGVLAAVVVRRRARSYPVAAVTGLAVGGMAAALIAWQVGKVFAPLDRAAAQTAKPGTIILDALDLGAKGLLLVLPVVALGTWLAIDMVTIRGQLPPTPDAGDAGGAEPAGPAEPGAADDGSQLSPGAHAWSGPVNAPVSPDAAVSPDDPRPPPPPPSA